MTGDEGGCDATEADRLVVLTLNEAGGGGGGGGRMVDLVAAGDEVDGSGPLRVRSRLPLGTSFTRPAGVTERGCGDLGGGGGVRARKSRGFIGEERGGGGGGGGGNGGGEREGGLCRFGGELCARRCGGGGATFCA